ncbi:FAD-binding oxidoreductase [Halobacillus litoralis]|uniref:FAD-binding oxidoreductase n=1 Tax=Halobacillus litoralis TaxID=45668 RepID=UPI001CFEC035|nr:FAD-binding oxidoreductase [Halobacillus litoralis]WLR48114.1 FAD-binding oxidoreductase [Halobacillus litoralis]
MLEQSKVESFSEKMRGHLVMPDDSNYDEVRTIWNGIIDRKPALIAQCVGTADVVSAVNFAREEGLEVSVKGGGHGVAGKAICDNGLMIDLSLMNTVRVDSKAKRVRVEGGAKLGDMDHETQAFGLATTAGMVSVTGVGGLTLGGGIGYLGRTYGLSADNLMSADVVTAEGKVIHASETENSDLLWALRGGGGNFGIVTSFEFKLYEVGPEVMTGQLFFPIEQGKEVLQMYRKVMDEAPDQLTLNAMVIKTPPAEPFPQQYHGKPALAIVGCYAGDLEKGRRLMEPLEDFGQPMLKMVQPMPYKHLQSSFDAANPDGGRYYWKSQFLKSIPDDALDTILDYSFKAPGAFTATFLEPMGGAINRIGKSDTAYPHRDAMYNLGVCAGWMEEEDDDACISWTREFHNKMSTYSTGGVYSNYLSEGEEERIKAAFGENFYRLQKIKSKYDPGNFFSKNMNIKPVSTT